MAPEKVNINVGILGHVDSGKTSLCKVLSTTASTAAFDSNPQSKERGITLDLGFSSLSLSDSNGDGGGGGPEYNFTLVDCPGHSSLIRTVIGGAQIMDIMLLIIDINKGLQAQAGECLILAHITSSHLIVVLNKLDLVPPESRPAKIAKVNKLMRGVLAKTKFSNEPIVCVSAADPSIGTTELKSTLLKKVRENKFERNVSAPLLMAVDHCFTIKGQGAIVTGTVLQGSVKINDMVEFPLLRESKKVKSIQSFKVPVPEAKAGDRVGICIPGLDSSVVERTVVSAPGLIRPSIRAGILTMDKIPFFKKPIQSKKKYHISIGYETVTARLTLFQSPSATDSLEKSTIFDPSLNYEFVEEIGVGQSGGETTTTASKKIPNNSGDSVEGGTSGVSGEIKQRTIFALLEFDRPVMAPPDCVVIGSDLQSEDENACRLAFSGRLIDSTQDKQYTTTYLPNLKIFKEKSKEGSIDRVVSENQLIAKGFCKKESNIDHLVGLKVNVTLADDSKDLRPIGARIESRFGQTNKVRLSLSEAMTAAEMKLLKDNVKNTKVQLYFKKYFFTGDKSTKLVQ